MLLSLGYGCGLRAGEVVRLKVKHIDTAQKIIRVEQGKGRKDRTLHALRHRVATPLAWPAPALALPTKAVPTSVNPASRPFLPVDGHRR